MDRNREQHSLGSERDLVLAPNTYCWISDESKGSINCFVGPYKSNLDGKTDKPVVFSKEKKRFISATLDQAIQAFSIAPDGWYIVLKNPHDSGKHPKEGNAGFESLEVGKKIICPGPVGFALWPGQMAEVVQGHNLRSNQYLITRVYDDAAAKANIQNTIIHQQKSEPEDLDVDNASAEGVQAVDSVLTTEGDVQDTTTTVKAEELSMGKLSIIKGTDVSFYIPPTGIEVVKSSNGNYVQEAVTLERLEYCILKDENGSKRYIRGPKVVFPKPTEVFVKATNGSRKYTALELNDISGIYVKVITDYTDEITHVLTDGRRTKDLKVGNELFITGKTCSIYFPREEHSLIEYDGNKIHYAVAIAPGEARYVLNRMTGAITIVRGPEMFLPDPRKELLVRRILSPGQVRSWFPNNDEALAYNIDLAGIEDESGEFGDASAMTNSTMYVSDRAARSKGRTYSRGIDMDYMSSKSALVEKVGEEFASEGFKRKNKFTQPRTVTLDTKYDGTVKINIYTGYAVNVISGSGSRKTIVGPATYHLEYDETLEEMILSTGKTKNDDCTITTPYLRVLNNRVSDTITIESKDFCTAVVYLAYRVNFEGEAKQWFSVENYVKFMTDRMRSIIKNRVKSLIIEDFYRDSSNILRDIVLNKTNTAGNATAITDDKPSVYGRVFAENGMRLIDCEVLEVRLSDNNIAQMLRDNQYTIIRQNLSLEAKERDLKFTQQTQVIARKADDEATITSLAKLVNEVKVADQQLKVELADLHEELEVSKTRLVAQVAEQEQLSKIHGKEIDRKKIDSATEIVRMTEILDLKKQEIEAKVAAHKTKVESITPQMVAAIQSVADKNLASSMAKNSSPWAMLGGEDVVDVLQKVVSGAGSALNVKSLLGREWMKPEDLEVDDTLITDDGNNGGSRPM